MTHPQEARKPGYNIRQCLAILSVVRVVSSTSVELSDCSRERMMPSLSRELKEGFNSRSVSTTTTKHLNS